MHAKPPENMNAFLLQIKGDTLFSLFSQATDVESLSEAWKLCTKVAGHLEQGERLENLSWRLFHLHSTMATDSIDNRTRTFERIGKKLDRERHLGLSQLQDPPLKSCCRMNQPMTGVSATIHHPTLLCSLSGPTEDGAAGIVNCTAITSSTHISFSPSHAWDFDFKTGSINFESLISSFSPFALLGAVDHFSHSQETCNIFENEASQMGDTAVAWDSLNYPTFNGPANEPLFHQNKVLKEYSTMIEPIQKVANLSHDNHPSSFNEPCLLNDLETRGDSLENQFMGSVPNLPFQNLQFNKESQEEFQCTEMNHHPIFLEEHENRAPGTSYGSTQRISTSNLQTNRKTEKVGEKRKRRNPMATRLPKFVGVPSLPERTPGDNLSEKSVCANCRGTHTPLWRRGPNDEILCNACGVFYNVHKRNRPPSLSKGNCLGNSTSNMNGDTKGQGKRIECTNCNAKATPMWRKAPDGSLLCNACALYFKCHKRSRPATYSRTTASQPLGVGAQPFNFGYGDQNASLGMIPPSFDFYRKDADFLSDPSSTVIHGLDQTFDGGNVYLNEPHELDFLRAYPACLYSFPNFFI